MQRICWVVDLGFIPYADACELQSGRCRRARRTRSRCSAALRASARDHAGAQRQAGDILLASDHVLQQKGVEFHATDRGGDITYHGPGQIVGLSVIRIWRRSARHWVVRAETGRSDDPRDADFGVAACAKRARRGVDRSLRALIRAHPTAAAAEKIAALGVHISRWVTSHGFAYNVATDLRYFELIVPCGIAERKATSLEHILDAR